MLEYIEKVPTPAVPPGFPNSEYAGRFSIFEIVTAPAPIVAPLVWPMVPTQEISPLMPTAAPTAPGAVGEPEKLPSRRPVAIDVSFPKTMLPSGIVAADEVPGAPT